MARTPRYDEALVRDAVARSRSLSEALRCLGLRPAGGNHQTLKRLIARYDISTVHFDPYWRQRAPEGSGVPLEQILVRNSTYHRGHLKRRLLAAGLKSLICELCGQGEMWRGRHMAMVLDHINGTPDDNRLENLRIVCPNCAATLDTHCGRKNAAQSAERRCAKCGGPFFAVHQLQKYCSRTCAPHDRPSGPRPSAWKAPHPPRDQLRREVEEHGYRATGRRHGVSDNAVRKWLRAYDERDAGR